MRKFFRNFLHPIGVIGIVLALAGFLSSSVLLVMDILEKHTSPYRGIFTFMLFPGVMFLGFGGMAIGWFLEARRSRRLQKESVPWRPAIDFKNVRHRRILMILSGSMLVFILASIIGGMRAFEFTESVNFCGQTCHEPMEPQYVAYLDSPHARVGCPECHVGPGVEHYVEAKLAGMRQVYKVLSDTISRPIFAPREKILPANETCEQCHWPEKFWGLQLDQRVRFGYDIFNSRRPIHIVMKTGGGSPNGQGPQQGIHWHMNIKNKVHYKALDAGLQQIAWVEVVRPDGQKRVFRDTETKASPAEIEKLPAHQMGCLDCHNRPAHHFHTPDEALDEALEGGTVDATLPFIKNAAVQALSKSYDTVETALSGIKSDLDGFYKKKFEGKVFERQETLGKAVEAIQSIYRRNNFPAMKVNGYTHPDNIGHREFPGCFRCHTERLKTDDGKSLDSRCDLCHLFMEQPRGTNSFSEVPADASYLHPWRGKDHLKVACWTCHTGSATPYAQCQTCHKQALDGHAMAFECSVCHKPGGPAVADSTCTPCHPTGASPMHAHKDHGDCLGCHKQHTWKADLVQNCSTCHKSVKPDHYPGQPCSPCHNFKGVLSQMKGLPASKKE